MRSTPCVRYPGRYHFCRDYGRRPGWAEIWNRILLHNKQSEYIIGITICNWYSAPESSDGWPVGEEVERVTLETDIRFITSRKTSWYRYYHCEDGKHLYSKSWIKWLIFIANKKVKSILVHIFRQRDTQGHFKMGIYVLLKLAKFIYMARGLW